MSSQDDIRAIDRFVAGLPVDDEELATALAARAIDRAIVVDAMLFALESDEDAVRLRAAKRSARMDDLSPRVVAALRLVAAHDPDLRVRAEAAAALRVHRELVPWDAAASASENKRSRQPLASLWLRVLVMRSLGNRPISLEPTDPDAAPAVAGDVSVAEDGLVCITLTGLPESYVGALPTVRVRREADLVAIATAAAPVAADGSVTIRVPREVGTTAEVLRWLGDELELVVAGATPP